MVGFNNAWKSNILLVIKSLLRRINLGIPSFHTIGNRIIIRCKSIQKLDFVICFYFMNKTYSFYNTEQNRLQNTSKA